MLHSSWKQCHICKQFCWKYTCKIPSACNSIAVTHHTSMYIRFKCDSDFILNISKTDFWKILRYETTLEICFEDEKQDLIYWICYRHNKSRCQYHTDMLNYVSMESCEVKSSVSRKEYKTAVRNVGAKLHYYPLKRMCLSNHKKQIIDHLQIL
jgi:hypothetical protein